METAEKINQIIDKMNTLMPEASNQILTWATYNAVCGIGCSLIGLLVFSLLAIATAYKAKKLHKEYAHNETVPLYIIASAFSMVFVCLTLLGLFANVSTLAKVRVAPMVVIIDRIAG